MTRSGRSAWLLLGLTGCVPGSAETSLVSSNPFTGPLPTNARVAKFEERPASKEAAVRVAQIGRKVVAANPQLGLNPVFSVIGSDSDEVFHRGTAQIIFTEGLVKKCASDGQVAAILCNELGKMVAEREAEYVRGPDLGPPMAAPVGDSGGIFGSPDGTRAAELAKYDRDHHRGLRPRVAPDMMVLARSYLARTEYPAAEFDAALPLLRAAESNVQLEKQMNASDAKGAAPARP